MDEKDEWTAGVEIGEPGYDNAARNLLLRWFYEQKEVPHNVLLAAGYVLARNGLKFTLDEIIDITDALKSYHATLSKLPTGTIGSDGKDLEAQKERLRLLSEKVLKSPPGPTY